MIEQFTSDVWLDTYRPDIISPESKSNWSKFHNLVRSTSVPVAVNGAFSFVQSIIDDADPESGYMGGGMHYQFWFKSATDRAQFLDELDPVLPNWRRHIELSSTTVTSSIITPIPKQVIVMRTDLNMRKGKMIAQGAHAAMKALLDMMPSGTCNERTLSVDDHPALLDWLDGSFTKICVRADSEQHLLDIYNKAVKANLISAIIQDSGKTEFNGIPTYTCCAIGPAYPSDIDHITGDLKLL